MGAGRRARVRGARDHHVEPALPARLRGRRMGGHRRARGRHRPPVRGRAPRVVRGRPGARLHGARLRRRDRHRLLDDLLLRVREPGALGADPRRDRGRSPLRPLRRRRHGAPPRPVPVLRRVVAVALFRAAGLHGRPRDLPRRRAHSRRVRRRLARPAAGAGGATGPRARRGGGGAPGRARPPRRRPRGCEPLRACARLVAGDRGGVRRIHRRAARVRPVRPHRDRARRERRRDDDRDRRPRRGRAVPARQRRAARRFRARAGAGRAHGASDATSPTRSTRRTACSSRSVSAASSSRRCRSVRGRSGC